MGPAIWFVPHQDDEVLSMGAAIKQHARAGRRCIVVLMTDGSNSGVKGRYPSEEEFVAERDREFNRAVKQMGAEPVIRADRAEDGFLTIAWALGVMQEYASQYPDASLKTMTPHDNHSDHANLGRALQQLDHPDKRYYVKRSQWDEISGKMTAVEDLRTELLDYAPVAWLSTRSSCEAAWLDGRNKWHA